MGVERRIRHIDGLRGIAVLSVVFYHTWLTYPVMRQNALANVVFNAGRHGVELFFVLSGFCLAYPTLLALQTRGSASFDVVKYAARRLVRIIPPYYAAIAVCGVILGVWLLAPGQRIYATDIIRQALFLDNGTAFVNGSFWTLAIEFRWYFLFPIALLLWVRAPRAFGIALLALPALWLTTAASNDVFYLPDFLLGIVAADTEIRGARAALYAPIAFLVLATIAALVDPNRGIPQAGSNALWGPVAFCLVVGAGVSATARRLCSMRWLVAVGIASYSIYLVHEPLLVLANRAGAVPVAAFIAALAAGFAFWAVAERPFVETALRDRLIDAVQRAVRHYAERLGLEDLAIPFARRRVQVAELEQTG